MNGRSVFIGGCVLLSSLAAPGLLLAAEGREVVPAAAELTSPQPREDLTSGEHKAVERVKRSISRGRKALELEERVAPRRREADDEVASRPRPGRRESSQESEATAAAAPEPTSKAASGVEGQQVFAAASSSVTIVDFDYVPPDVTVNVGDSVTWTNSGDEPHTATADNGSFDTPVLNSGQSASVTLAQPGTFSYFCKLHPPQEFPGFTGTVEVVDSSGEAGGGSTGAGDAGAGDTGAGDTGAVDAGAGEAAAAGTGAAGSSGAAGGGGALPFTGHETAWLALVGAALLTLGGAVQRRSEESL